MSKESFEYCWMLSLKVDVILLVGGFKVLILTPSSLVDLPPITRSNNKFGFSLHYHQIIVIIIIFRQLYDVGIISVLFSPDFSCISYITVELSLSGSTNCFYFDFRLLAYEGHALVSQADTLFGNGCDKDWIRYGIIMVWIKTSWSPWSGLREGATTTINAAQHHRQLLPLWTGLIVLVTIIGLESFGKSLDLQILPPPPPHKRTKEKSCTVFYGSSCWLRHHPDTVEAPSTATTTAWAPPWLLRQWFSLFVVL